MRYVVTNIKGDSKEIYEMYCGRGEMENRIKDTKGHLFACRSSSVHWLANQFRVLLSSLAYTLVEGVRSFSLQGTELATSDQHNFFKIEKPSWAYSNLPLESLRRCLITKSGGRSCITSDFLSLFLSICVCESLNDLSSRAVQNTDDESGLTTLLSLKKLRKASMDGSSSVGIMLFRDSICFRKISPKNSSVRGHRQ